MAICVKESMIESFETLLSLLLKSNDNSIILSAGQIIDRMVETALKLDSQAANRSESNAENGNDKADATTDPAQTKLLACLTALSLFARTRPALLIHHVEIFVPYLSISVSSAIESRVLNQLILMLERVVPLIEHPSDNLLRQLDTRLNDIVRDGGMVLIASSVSCMSVIYNKFKRIKPGICSTFITYLRYLEHLKAEMEANSATYEIDPEKKPILLRSLYSIGLMCRFFNFDELIESTANSKQNEPADDDLGYFHSLVFSVLFFFSRTREFTICQKALISLGQISAGCSAILKKNEVKHMYMVLLNIEKPDFLPLKIQILKNLSCFLHAEEEKALKKAEEIKAIREEQQTDQMDLKEMELSNSGLSSAIIQQYWTAILNCFFHNDVSIRTNTAQVIWQTLEQGLVTPGSSIPTLISMSTDPIQTIRAKTENLMKDMNNKYKGMIVSKAVPGVRMSYQLQKKIQPEGRHHNVIRGIRLAEDGLEKKATGNVSASAFPKLSGDAQALLSSFYVSLRSNRQQRRSLLSTLLRLFSEDLKEKIEIDEWIYLADNLAHFPYQVMDEPLFVIHQADSIISVSGQNILGSFKQLLLPNDQPKDPNGEDIDEFSVKYIYDHLPENKSRVYELKRNSQACFVLLYLKTYLMRAFALKKEKVSEYSPSEAANVYEKSISRKNIAIFSPDSVLNELQQSNESQSANNLKLKLAEDFHRFYEMLLCVQEDQKDDDDNDAE